MLISYIYIHLQHTFHHHNKKRLSQRLINISISSTNLVPLLPYKHHLGPSCVWLNIQGGGTKCKRVCTSVWRNPKSERNRIRNFFPIPIFFDTESDTFFDTKFFPIPIPILFSIPNFFETDTDTFFDTKKNRNRYQYFYRYQNFSKPIPILSKNIEKFRNQYRYFFRYQKILKPIPVLLSIPKNFETDTIKKHRKVLEPNLKLFRSKFVDWIMSLL